MDDTPKSASGQPPSTQKRKPRRSRATTRISTTPSADNRLSLERRKLRDEIKSALEDGFTSFYRRVPLSPTESSTEWFMHEPFDLTDILNEDEKEADESAAHTEDHLMAGDHSVIVDVEKKAMEDESNGVRRLEESMDDVEVMNEEMGEERKGTLEDGDHDGGLEGGQMDAENEKEKIVDRRREEEDEEEDELDEEDVEEDDGEEEEAEANNMRMESSGGEESQEEEVEDDIEDDDALEESGLAQLDKTLPISSVDNSIVHLPLRRLLAVCNQERISKMDELMSSNDSARKVGEGSYAEVFLVKKEHEEEGRVLKIIRMEEEDAKKYIGEVIISKELTKLRGSSGGSTTSFAKMFSAKVLQGPLPPILAKAWEEFKEAHKEDEGMNDENPEGWEEEQLSLLIECNYGGQDLRRFPFSTVLEVVAIFCQTALALAVAEAEFQFEHRDLHEENVLVKKTRDERLKFVFNGEDSNLPETITVPTHGVRSTLIDFTLSRMTKGGEIVFHDITDDVCEQEEEAEQYQVYKKMKKLTKGKWMKYTPKSNVLWLRMQLNWIIDEILRTTSATNKARVKAWKKKKNQPTAQLEEEEEEISGADWLKKVKEGTKVIGTLKEFVKNIDKFKSAHELVTSKKFKILLNLLE